MNKQVVNLVYRDKDGNEEVVVTVPAADTLTALCEASWQGAVATGIVEE